MDLLVRVLTGLAALAFVLAVIGSLLHREIAGTPPEAFSRACTNLALLAIAVAFAAKAGASSPGA